VFNINQLALQGTNRVQQQLVTLSFSLSLNQISYVFPSFMTIPLLSVFTWRVKWRVIEFPNALINNIMNFLLQNE
jgi:hypothetical protein